MASIQMVYLRICFHPFFEISAFSSSVMITYRSSPSIILSISFASS
jgi:hypothetical protein